MGKSKLDDVKTKSFESLAESFKKKDKNPNEKKVIEPLYTSIPMDLIVFKTNIRSKYFDEDIIELAESMKSCGQLQPCQVYEENDEYVIIYGHRRYLAAKEAGLNELNCIIVDKPSDIDTIYIQVVENEQSKSLSAKDREAYIKKLRDMGQSFEDIAKKVGKTVQWIRQCVIAAEVREENTLILNQANIEFSTTDLYKLRNASEDDFNEALKLTLENPEEKGDILSDINKRRKKKQNVGGKRKNTASDDFLISFRVILDEKEKSFSIMKESIADLTDFQVNSVSDLLCQIYTEKGYNQKNKL